MRNVAPWVAEVYAEAFPSHPNDIYGYLERPSCLVISDPEQRGFLVMDVVLDTAEILTLAVARHSQRQGVAESLFMNAFEILQKRGVHRLFLEVSASNTPALALYQKIGFSQIGVRKDYYSRPNLSDALVMEKIIP